MKYKVGDLISIKSKKDILKTCKNISGDLGIEHGNYITLFNEENMAKFCGKTVKVLNISNDCYVIKDPNRDYHWYFPEQWVDPFSKKIKKILKI